MVDGQDWPPQASAIHLPDGERRRGSTGQLFEVKNGTWVRMIDRDINAELVEKLVDCLSFDRPASCYRMVEEARNLMLAYDRPVGNDSRYKRVYQLG
jgi:hypothetical protein